MCEDACCSMDSCSAYTFTEGHSSDAPGSCVWFDRYSLDARYPLFWNELWDFSPEITAHSGIKLISPDMMGCVGKPCAPIDDEPAHGFIAVTNDGRFPSVVQ